MLLYINDTHSSLIFLLTAINYLCLISSRSSTTCIVVLYPTAVMLSVWKSQAEKKILTGIICTGVVTVFAGFGITHCFGYFRSEVEHSPVKVRRTYCCVSELSPQICLYLLAVITSNSWLQYSHLIWNLWYISLGVSISSVVWESSTSIIYPCSRISRSEQGKGMLPLVGMGSAYHSTAWEKGILTYKWPRTVDSGDAIICGVGIETQGFMFSKQAYYCWDISTERISSEI